MKRYAICILILQSLLSGCKTSKILTPAIATDRTEAELLDAIEAHNYDFSWFAGEADLSLDAPDQTFSGKTIIRIRKDSVIWSAVKKASVEGGRVLLTPEMYAAINRLDGTYTRGSSADVLASMGASLDFYDIQQAIFGNVILPEPGQYQIAKASPSVYTLATSSGGFDLVYDIDAANLQISRIRMVEASRTIDIELMDYKDVGGKMNFAHSRRYLISDPKNGTAVIKLHYKKVEVDKPKQLKFTIPPHYEEVK